MEATGLLHSQRLTGQRHSNTYSACAMARTSFPVPCCFRTHGYSISVGAELMDADLVLCALRLPNVLVALQAEKSTKKSRIFEQLIGLDSIAVFCTYQGSHVKCTKKQSSILIHSRSNFW
jgi:hypothetical protein